MCTVAAVVAFLGFMPPKGTQIIVPRSQLSQYTHAQQSLARRCAGKYGIQWKVDEER